MSEDLTKILRVCKKCGIEKTLNGFTINKGCTHGRTHMCIDCYNKNFGKDYRDKLHDRPKISVLEKMCRHCGMPKPINEFHKKEQSKDGYSNVCARCQSVYIRNYKNTPEGGESAKRGHKKYYRNNKQKWIDNRETEHYQKYRESEHYRGLTQKSQKEYYEKNKKTLNKQAIACHKRRKKESKSVFIASIVRGQLHRELGKRKFGVKTADLLGCTYDFFAGYIESKFQEGMTWDNHAQFGWHLDHILPIASFNLEDMEQLKKCFHYTNYQPLWWRDNLRKGVKILIA